MGFAGGSSVVSVSVSKKRPLNVGSVTRVGSSGRLSNAVWYAGKVSSKIGGVGQWDEGW